MNSWWSEPMPAGWEAKWDANQNRYFFIDHATKKTTWVDPRSPQGRSVRAPQPPAAFQTPMQNMNPYPSQYGGATQRPVAQNYGTGAGYSGYGTGSGYGASTQRRTQETSFVENSGSSKNAKMVNNVLHQMKDEMNLTDEQIQEFLADADNETLRDLGVKVDSSESEEEEDMEEAKYSALIGKLRARYADDLPDDVIMQVVYSYERNEDRITQHLKEKGYLTKQEKNVIEAKEREQKRKQEELFRELKRKYPDIEAGVVKLASQMDSKSESLAMLDDIKRTMEEDKRKKKEAERKARLKAEAEKREREEQARRQAEEDDRLMKQLMEEERENQLRIEEEIRKTEEELKRTHEAMKRTEREKTPTKQTATKPTTSKSSKGGSTAKTTKTTPRQTPAPKKSASPRKSSTKPEWKGSGLANGPNRQLPHGPNRTLLGEKMIHAVGPSIHTFGPSQACGPNHNLAMGPAGIAYGPMNLTKHPVYV